MGGGQLGGLSSAYGTRRLQTCALSNAGLRHNATGSNSLAETEATRSNTSVCLKVVDPRITALYRTTIKRRLPRSSPQSWKQEDVAYDIGGYRDAPPGLRVWAGATIEASDIEALLPWLDWAFARMLGRTCRGSVIVRSHHSLTIEFKRGKRTKEIRGSPMPKVLISDKLSPKPLSNIFQRPRRRS